MSEILLVFGPFIIGLLAGMIALYVSFNSDTRSFRTAWATPSVRFFRRNDRLAENFTHSIAHTVVLEM